MNIGIYIYPQAEVLDFSGPYEVFTTASRLNKKEEILFKPLLIAENAEVQIARGNYCVVPHHSIDRHPPLDVILVSGGYHLNEMNNPTLHSWLRKTAPHCKLVGSICTGVFILAAAGIIQNQRVTTHWEDIQDLRKQFPKLTVVENCNWVEDGKIVTSAGISAGIDMALHLVAQFSSMDLAKATAKQMEYRWNSVPS